MIARCARKEGGYNRAMSEAAQPPGGGATSGAPELEVGGGEPGTVPEAVDGYEFVSESIKALFGSTHRTSGWSVPDHLDISATFGDVTVDFRRAELPPDGIVQIDARALFGHVILVVPEGAEVEIEGQWTLFGEIGHSTGWLGLRRFLRRFVTGDVRGDEARALDAEPFLLRVSGSAVFGEISVKSRD